DRPKWQRPVVDRSILKYVGPVRFRLIQKIYELGPYPEPPNVIAEEFTQESLRDSREFVRNLAAWWKKARGIAPKSVREAVSNGFVVDAWLGRGDISSDQKRVRGIALLRETWGPDRTFAVPFRCTYRYGKPRLVRPGEVNPNDPYLAVRNLGKGRIAMKKARS